MSEIIYVKLGESQVGNLLPARTVDRERLVGGNNSGVDQQQFLNMVFIMALPFGRKVTH